MINHWLQKKKYSNVLQ